MIGYVTLGTTDVSRAAAFYDGVLGEMNAKRVMEEDGFVAWSQDGSSPMLSLITPFNGERATVGNGVMVALAVRARDQVARLHAKALAMGGVDEGAPGLREESFCGAYFLDLDGHKVAIYAADSFA
ncbi:MAG: glyoxalase [Thiotrichales bacterium]|nr:glyoxalase [Thiotrichales bacterium]